MKRELAIQNAELGKRYIVVGANSQSPGLRIGDVIRIAMDVQGRLYRNNLTRSEIVPLYGTDPCIWVSLA